MRKNVGKQIMDIAENYEQVARIVAWVLGGLTVLGGVILFLCGVSFLAVLIAIVVAALEVCIAYGLAKINMIRMYGYGILVDAAEEWKNEHSVADKKTEKEEIRAEFVAPPCEPPAPTKPVSGDRAAPIVMNGYTVMCPRCKKLQVPDRKRCFACGLEFLLEEG